MYPCAPEKSDFSKLLMRKTEPVKLQPSKETLSKLASVKSTSIRREFEKRDPFIGH
jgi:hypothetical protein